MHAVDGAKAVIWRPRLAFGLALLALAILSLLYVRQSDDLAATGYDVANLQQSSRDWQRRNEQLQVDVARLQAVDQVAQLASQRLSMGPPRHTLFVRSTPISVPAFATPTASDATDSEPLIHRDTRLWPSPP
jgi:hypothetical protein